MPAVIEPDLQEQAITVLKENKSYPTRKNDRKYLLTADCDVRCAGYRGCMSAHSLVLREKIVEPVKKGVPKSETARPFRGRSCDGQTLLQAARRVWHLRAEEGSGQEIQAR